MKRNLIYGLLICLFVFCSQVGVGQTYNMQKNGWGNATISSQSICNGLPTWHITNGSDWGSYKYYVDGIDITQTYKNLGSDHIIDNDGLTDNKNIENGGLKMRDVSEFYAQIDVANQTIKVSASDPCVIPTEESKYSVRVTYNESSPLAKGESCGGKILIQVKGDNKFSNGFCIYYDNTRYNLFNPKWTFDGFSAENMFVRNGDVYGLKIPNTPQSINGWVRLDLNSKTIEYIDGATKPNCGLQVPNINNGNSTVCLSNIRTITAPTVDGASRKGWYINNNKADNLASVQVGDVIKYYAIDDSDVESTSNEVTIIDIPSISNIADISYCAALGAYDLSAHVVSDNGASATTVWKRNENTITGNPTLASGDVLYVSSTNACGTTEGTMNVTNGCRPQIPTISNPDAICNGGTVALSVPANIDYYDASADSYEWQIYENGTWRTFNTSETLDYDDYSGSARIRLAATNGVGTSYSNEITVTINPDAPDFTVSETGDCFEPYHDIPHEIEYRFNKIYPCNTDAILIEVSGVNADKFNLSGSAISLVPNLEEGTYMATVTFSSGGYEVEKKLSCSVSNYPKTYTLKRCHVNTCSDFSNYEEWTDFEIITTDPEGNLSLTMPSDNGYLYVNTSDISCKTFNLHSSATDHCVSRFMNVGTLNATESLNIGSSSSRIGGVSPFITTCTSVMIAPTINLYTKQSTDSLKGVFRSEHFSINHDQGGTLEVKECAFIKSTDATIYIAGGSMDFNMKGHLISDDISINNPTTYVNMSGIMTIGNVTGGTKIVVGKNGTVNLCVNPTQSGDNLGMTAGTVLYNYGDFAEEHGWGASNPKDEVDINDPSYVSQKMYLLPGCTVDDVNNAKFIKAYKSYEDCISEKDMASFLPIELVSFSFDKIAKEFVWKTASETNNDYFVIEYSKNGKDWVECSEYVSSVSVNGYSYSVKPNMSINNSLFLYFRLKQVDNNGEYSYSNVITVSFSVENPCSEEYESSKVQIRDFGNKWFRYINGELIYCENDN